MLCLRLCHAATSCALAFLEDGLAYPLHLYYKIPPVASGDDVGDKQDCAHQTNSRLSHGQKSTTTVVLDVHILYCHTFSVNSDSIRD